MKKIALRFSGLAAVTIAVGGWAIAAGGYDRGALQSEMQDAVKHTRVILGALIAADWGKAKAEATALAAQGKTIRALSPQAGAGGPAEFPANADSLGARAARLAITAKAHDGARSAATLGQIVATCMTCHSLYRK